MHCSAVQPLLYVLVANRLEDAQNYPTVFGPFLHSLGMLLTAMKYICFLMGLGIGKLLGRGNEAIPKADDAIHTFP